MGLHKTTKVYKAGLFLTQGERNVLKHIAMGLSNEEIAECLNTTITAIREHIKNIYYKLGINGINKYAQRVKASLWYWQKERGFKL